LLILAACALQVSLRLQYFAQDQHCSSEILITTLLGTHHGYSLLGVPLRQSKLSLGPLQVRQSREGIPGIRLVETVLDIDTLLICSCRVTKLTARKIHVGYVADGNRGISPIVNLLKDRLHLYVKLFSSFQLPFISEDDRHIVYDGALLSLCSGFLQHR
jgi:hypothetical protein